YARYLPDEVLFRAPNAKVFEVDFFDFEKFCSKRKINKKFDRVVGNPPWGDHIVWLDERFHKQIKNFKSYKRASCISIYVYEEAVKFLKDDGRIGMVIKHEVLAGSQHENFRTFMTSMS